MLSCIEEIQIGDTLSFGDKLYKVVHIDFDYGYKDKMYYYINVFRGKESRCPIGTARQLSALLSPLRIVKKR